MTSLCAVDPGIKGGLAYLINGVVSCFPMPSDDLELIDLIKNNPVDLVLFEWILGFFGKERTGTSMVTFGWVAGAPYWLSRREGYPIQKVPPLQWMHALKMGTVSQHKNHDAWKQHLCDQAKRLFPKLKVTLKTCDALLILHAKREGLI